MPRAAKDRSESRNDPDHTRKRHRHRPPRPPTPRPPVQAAAAPQLHPSTFAAFNAEHQSWLPVIPCPTIWSAETSLTLLTLNTWSSAPSHSPHQTLALYSLLQSSQADVIALQEVTKPFWDGLVELFWVRDGYAAAGGGAEGWWSITESAAAGGRQRSGGRGKKGAREAVVMLVQKTLVGPGSEVGIGTLGRARDEAGKGWVEVRLRDGSGNEKARIATSHFSSLPVNSALRQSQYQTVLQSLHSCSPSASSLDRLNNSRATKILLGDFNAASAAEFSAITTSYPLIDAFTVSPSHLQGPHAPQPHHQQQQGNPRPTPAQEEASFKHPPTFGHLYPYVPGAPRSKPRKARRIDRVYFSTSPTSSLRCSHYSHIGEAALHFPLKMSTEDDGGSTSAVAHHHRRKGGKKGPKIRDRDSVDGWMRASDHAGVRVVLEVI